MRRSLTSALVVAATLLPPVTSAQKSIGKMTSGDATVRGAVTLSGSAANLMSGAYVESSASSATVTLERGGELTICPNSGVTLTSSASGKEQLIGISSGGVETHYALGAGSDSIMTPDFRLQFTGPGDFHFGVKLGTNGEVCVQGLEGSTGSVVVNELLGDGTYQVKPGEVVRFRNGSVANADSGGRSSCGCTKPRTQSAAVAPPADLGFPEQQSKEAAEAIASGRPAPHSNPPIQLPPTSQPGEVQLQIDAPMVFRGDGPAVAEPPMPAIMARKTLKPPAFPEFPELAVQPPALQTTEPATSKPKKRNFFSKFGSAIAWLFKKHDKQIPQR